MLVVVGKGDVQLKHKFQAQLGDEMTKTTVTEDTKFLNLQIQWKFDENGKVQKVLSQVGRKY